MHCAIWTEKHYNKKKNGGEIKREIKIEIERKRIDIRRTIKMIRMVVVL